MILKSNAGKQKMLIFHPALTPYRIDQFNSLNEIYDLEVVFLFGKLWNFAIDQQNLEKECHYKISYLLNGPRYKGRLFRFGMYRKIKEVNPDVILGYEYSFTTQYLIFLKSVGLIKQKIGSSIDDSLDICMNVQSKTRKLIRDYSVKHLDFVVVMSEEVARFYRNNFMFDEKQVIVSPILQLPERLRKDPEKIESLGQDYISKYSLTGKKVILFVGRFIPEKALPLFIDTVAPILAEWENVVLVLVGEGEQKEMLSTLVKEKKLEGKVIFPGKFQAEELYGWYACASGFVLPSLSETFGAVVNEALIFGLTVLCSRYAGASSLIHPGNGILFNPSNSSDTREKLQQYVDNLKPTGDVCLAARPVLMDDQAQNFIKEWGKLNYE
ncbi:MAG: hypothetical protein BGO34_08755 [Bacteroidia bacterium 44-10]|nr:MAG: hypothetical protein BGO34_08755 [Bacteroidia bacterium 44-10]